MKDLLKQTALVILLLSATGCDSQRDAPPPMERVADNPVVEDAQEIGDLLFAATGACADFEHPIVVSIRGVDPGVCTFMGDEISIMVFTREGGVRGGKAFALRGRNWVISGEPAALEVAQQAIGGTLNAGPTPAEGAEVSFDAEYASDPPGLIDLAQSIVRAEAIGSEEYVDGVDGGESLGFYRQAFKVLDDAWGNMKNGEEIDVIRVDVSPDAKAEGAVLADGAAGPFEAGEEYALLLTEGVDGTSQGEYSLLAGHFQGEIPIVNGALQPRYPPGHSDQIAEEFRDMPWDEFKGLARRHRQRG